MENYEKPTPCRSDFQVPRKVKIKLKQHVGAPASPVVSEGEGIRKNDLIAKIQDGKLGANIHASIDGIISKIEKDYIIIEHR